MDGKVIWKKPTRTKKTESKENSSPDKLLGYLYLSFREGKMKTKLIGLKLDPIEKKHFNPKTKRLRTSFSKHEYYNNVIEKRLNEIQKKGNKFILINDDKKSFIEFMDLIIERTENQGTILKYTNIKNLLLKFNSEKYGDIDVKFYQIDVDFIENFKKWLRENRGNTQNSITYKIKCFKSFINKSIKEKIYYYDVNPFLLIKNKLEETNIEILNKEDLMKIIKTPIKEVYRSNIRFGEIITDEKRLKDKRYRHEYTLEDVKKFFLFQLFCQGFRVSDLMTLRWNDFNINDDEIRIKKKMIKTKSYVDILVNYNTMDYLKHYVPVEYLPKKLYDELMKINEIEILNLTKNKRKIKDFSTNKIGFIIDEKNINKYNFNFEKTENLYWVSYDEVEELIKLRNKELENFENIDDVLHHLSDGELRLKDEKLKYLKTLKKLIELKTIYKNETIDNKMSENSLNRYLLFRDIINYLSSNEKTKTMFCFPLLKSKDFKSIDEKNDFGLMTQLQYTRFTGGRTYYNRLLKIISQQCGITKPLKSHLSRHSYTSLMLEIGENLNLFDLMTSLGHKHLNTTQVYIQKFNNKNVDILNKQLSDYLNKK